MKSPKTMKTPEKIKAAARAIIAEKGLDGLSMRKLATVVGIKGPSIYKHFSGKEELLAILRGEAQGKLFDLMSEAKANSVESKILAMGEAYLQFSKDYPEEFKLLFFESNSGRKSLDEEVTSANPYGLLKEAFQGLLKGSSNLKVETLSYGFWSLVHGMAALGLSHLERFQMDFKGANRQAMEAYLAGIKVDSIL